MTTTGCKNKELHYLWGSRETQVNLPESSRFSQRPYALRSRSDAQSATTFPNSSNTSSSVLPDFFGT
jgi:hypothetical protein